MAGTRTPGAFPEELDQAFDDLGVLLLRASNVLGQERQANVTGAAATQQRVLMILMVNTACGAILCAAGVFFVRRWVMHPIADLREATRQISQGDFAYRIRPRSHDELGQLAEEVNQMSATVVEMQTQLVEQERLAAAGEMVTRLAHNIRNPLAGIRGLAEATLGLHTGDTDTVGCQQRIIDTVDRFEKWLRDLQQSVSPLELSPQRISVRDLLNDVVTALRPMLDRHGVRVEVEVDANVQEAHLDSLHFEQALVALVTNAVQASTSGQVVRIRAESDSQGRGRWQLTVEDEGVGIPPELRRKIFLPYFTTKPEGSGIGLTMANKVVRLHGGQLTVESEVGSGSRFSAVMPGLASEV
jgi:signal transduction histidine kinase